jgi:hypothetical protein
VVIDRRVPDGFEQEFVALGQIDQDVDHRGQTHLAESRNGRRPHKLWVREPSLDHLDILGRVPVLRVEARSEKPVQDARQTILAIGRRRESERVLGHMVNIAWENAGAPTWCASSTMTSPIESNVPG